MNDEVTPAHRSLPSRLKDWKDGASWQEFYETYRKFIFKTACRAGLRPDDAEDVVQETFIAVSKAIRTFDYDPRKGSFRAWLRTATIWRVRDHWRSEQRGRLAPEVDWMEALEAGSLAESGGKLIGDSWESDWEEDLMEAALERVKNRVDPGHFQIFDLAMVQDWPTERIATTLGVKPACVYLVKHRVRLLVKAELKRLRAIP